MSSKRAGHIPFNSDVQYNAGYRYTTQAPLSSILANQRLTNITLALIPNKKMTLVDVGCGDGTYTAHLMKKRQKWSIKGFDPATKAIKLAQKYISKKNFFVADLLKPATLPKKKYDQALIRGVIHHLPNPEKGIKNLPLISSKLLIIEPNGNNPLVKIIEKTSPYHRAHREQSFSTRQLINWLEKYGYKVTKTHYVGLVPFFFPTSIARILKRIEPFIEESPLAPILCGQIVLVAKKSKLNSVLAK